MKRFVWIAVIFGGGMGALMLAAIMLMQQTERLGPAHNLRAALVQVRTVLLDWNYDTIQETLPNGRKSPIIEKETYRQLFDDAHADDPAQKARHETFLALIDAFPTIRFDDADAEVQTLEIHYEIKDGGCDAKLGVLFGRSQERGWIVYRVTPTVVLSPADRPATFVEGKPVPLEETFEKLFQALVSDEKAFAELVVVPEEIDIAGMLSGIRRSVTRVGNERIRKLLPQMAPLPRGVQSLRMRIEGRVRGKALRLLFDLAPVHPPRFRELLVILLRGPDGIEPHGPEAPAEPEKEEEISGKPPAETPNRMSDTPKPR